MNITKLRATTNKIENQYITARSSKGISFFKIPLQITLEYVR